MMCPHGYFMVSDESRRKRHDTDNRTVSVQNNQVIRTGRGNQLHYIRNNRASWFQNITTYLNYTRMGCPIPDMSN